MVASFSDRAAFVGAIAERWPSEVMPVDVRDALADGIARADESLQLEQGTSSPGELELRLGRWFLRDDDSPFFDTTIAVAPVLAALIAGGLALPAAIGAAASLGRATWRVWRKGGRLTRAQVAVVAALEAGGPLSVDELQSLVKDELGDDGVRDVLMSLQDVELGDGSGASLVRAGRDGRWRVVGI